MRTTYSSPGRMQPSSPFDFLKVANSVGAPRSGFCCRRAIRLSGEISGSRIRAR